MYRAMMSVSRVMAILGGAVLTVLILLTCISITGRLMNGWLHDDFARWLIPGLADWLIAAGVGPVQGDFELVEAGVAFAIFAFIPLCQITGSHASVDIFTNFLPDGAQRVLMAVIDTVFALVLILIAWRLFAGMESKYDYGETTLLLQFPIWWAYAASFAASVIGAIVGVYVAYARIVEAATGRVILMTGVEAGT